MNTDKPVLLLIFRVCPIFLDDNVNENVNNFQVVHHQSVA